KPTCRDVRCKPAAARRNCGPEISDVLAPVEGSIAVEYFCPLPVRYAHRILIDDVSVRKSSVVEAGENDDLLIACPSFEYDQPVIIRLVQNVDVMGSDRGQISAQRD